MARAHFRDHVQNTQGDAIAGAVVYIYDQGTTDEITETIYSEDDTVGNTTLNNPLTTGADGLLEFFLNDEKRVDLRISGNNYTTSTKTEDVLKATSPSASSVTLRKNTGVDVGTRPRINLIEGSGITLTLADDAVNSEVDVTITGSPLLAYVQYFPAVQTDYDTTSDTYEDVDATNLAITFTVPSTGNVMVRLQGMARVSSAAADMHWCLREGVSDIANSRRLVVAGSGLAERLTTCDIFLTGLTPGDSKTYKWGFRKFGLGETGYIATGPDNQDGPAIMQVWTAP